MSLRRIAVIGGGVIGLTCAVRLARAGHRVSVHAADRPRDTVSAVAGALWFPYDARPAAAVLAWATASLGAFTALASDPSTGVAVREGTILYRTEDPDLTWTSAVNGHRPAKRRELPAGIASGVVCALPLITMATYLDWLAARCVDLGVAFHDETVRSLDTVAPDAETLVVAAGLRSGELTGDTTMVPVRGQVVRLANPGLTRWLVDDDNPAGMTYVFPRGDDVVCGGTSTEGETSRTVDPGTEQAILARATELVPALAGAPVVSRAVGLRPGRPSVRLDRGVYGGRDVISCYGHGGSGVTLSWGCAEDVTRMAA